MDNDDYTAKMVELIELMRAIGNDTQQCEVKECARRISTTITDTLSAFSNGSGGYIILGLSEKNGFTPVEGFNARSMQESLSQACEKLTPVVRPVVVTCPFEGTNLVFAVVDEMLPREKPCYYTEAGPYNGSYIRTGDGDRHLTAYEVDRLLEEQHQPENDIAIVDGAIAEDLNPKLTEALLASERRKHPRAFEGREDIDMLLDLRVLRAKPPTDSAGRTARRKGKSANALAGLCPTLAGLLAFGNYPQKFFPRLNVTAAMFPGISRDEVFASGKRLIHCETFVGTIPAMVEDAVDAVMRWTRGGAAHDGAASSSITASAPYSAAILREVVANALVHRDYSADSLGTPVHVDVFTDRIEITNPGGLFGAVTSRTLKRPISTSTRNPFLFSLLRATTLAGSATLSDDGTGYEQIEAILRNEHRPPVRIDNSIGSFRITIPTAGRVVTGPSS
ncbi:ATP-binding protein [Bifidobacterium moukalabense]|uniref:ATP-binding protein n=1 Tax=Bifidobacterium moukalabense TaxID=1333651 RepID=UPI0010F619E4|nr:ATP-binding protein [Bifidobacterium moukalabense]